uniref:Uncharacterized protein n=1 Tax=viral metagenome TaxID=1070528 RepID=A0A6C0BKL3_9ZZZZ
MLTGPQELSKADQKIFRQVFSNKPANHKIVLLKGVYYDPLDRKSD